MDSTSGKEISIKSVVREIRERFLAHLIKAADAAESCASAFRCVCKCPVRRQLVISYIVS